jgi:hypothetical protein
LGIEESENIKDIRPYLIIIIIIIIKIKEGMKSIMIVLAIKNNNIKMASLTKRGGELKILTKDFP